MKRIIAISGAIAISACSTIEKDYSAITNWDDFGYQTALSGQVTSTKSELIYADNEEYDKYLIGYERGQKAYCDQDAYLLGLTSQEYNGICDKINSSFIHDYEYGLSQIEPEGSGSSDYDVRMSSSPNY